MSVIVAILLLSLRRSDTAWLDGRDSERSELPEIVVVNTAYQQNRRCEASEALFEESRRSLEPSTALALQVQAVLASSGDCLIQAELAIAVSLTTEQPMIASRLARHALARSSDALQRDRAVAILADAIDNMDNAWSIESPRGNNYALGDVIPVRIKYSGLIPKHPNDLTLQLCTYVDDLTLVSCSPGSSLTNLDPGWHSLTATVHGMPSGTIITKPLISHFCIHKEDDDPVCTREEMKHASLSHQPQTTTKTRRWLFMSLVLNGMPFITHHYRVLSALAPDEWEWHLVEGVAGRPYSKEALDKFHNGRGLSIDGSSEYIDALAAESEGQIFVYRNCQAQDESCFWTDKLAMVNEAMRGMRPGPNSFLLQLDLDELWTADRLHRAADLLQSSGYRCAFFHCHFLVGRQLATATPTTGYGHSDHYEWLRLWRMDASKTYAISHAPPMFVERRNGSWAPIAERCLDHHSTAGVGAVFTHHAYVEESQVKFKAAFYGYDGALQGWQKLQAVSPPVRLAEYLPWLREKKEFNDTIADIPAFAAAQILGPSLLHTPGAGGPLPAPSAQEASAERARAEATANKDKKKEVCLVIDAVAFQRHRSGGIRRVWSELIPLLAAQVPLTVIRRAGSELSIEKNDRIRFVDAPPFADSHGFKFDALMLSMLCQRLGASAFISTEYTVAPYGAWRHLTLLHDLTPEKFGWNDVFWRVVKPGALRQADVIIAVSNATATAFFDFYPTLAQEKKIIVSRNGVDLARFRPGLTQIEASPPRPYLLWVGPRAGYKNGLTLFRALYHARAPSSLHLWFVGGDPLNSHETSLVGGAHWNLSYTYTPHLNDDQLAAAYANAIALVYLSRDEGFGLPVLEALAAGCPVLASRIPALVQLLADTTLPHCQHNEVNTSTCAAVTVPSDSLTAIWHGIRALVYLDKQTERRQAARTALRRRASNFSGWQALANHFLDNLPEDLQRVRRR